MPVSVTWQDTAITRTPPAAASRSAAAKAGSFASLGIKAETSLRWITNRTDAASYLAGDINRVSDCMDALVEELAGRGCKAILSSDCHSADAVCHGFEKARALAAQYGVQLVEKLLPMARQPL